MKLSTVHIDYLNIGLILLSLVLAFLLPFRLFIFSYAVLGPLHYLTEINWLDGKSYFVHTRKLIWVFVVFSILFALPFVMELPLLATVLETESVGFAHQFLKNHINALVLLAFAISISLVATQNKYARIVIILAGLLLAVLLNSSGTYNLWMGIYIPTVVHVFVFTFLFMLYGALKAKSKAGLIASLFVLAVPIIIALFNIDPGKYQFTDQVKDAFLASDFYILSAKLAGKLGMSDGNQFFFYEQPYLKIQVFLAFAYTYHYLNWFSKTNIIGWNKGLNAKKTIIILCVWIGAVALYLIDFRSGFLLLISLSLLHVFAEFPLNVLSVKGIIEELRKA